VFDLINGLPVHPLVVHAVVVLVPLAALGTIAVALRPPWRSTYGPLVVLAGILSVILCPVATSSGESLERRVGDPGEHARLGDQLVWFVIPVAVLALALVLLERRRTSASAASAGGTSPSSASRAGSPAVLTVVAAFAVIAALATCVQVFRVGESGATSVWGGQVSSSSGSAGDDSGADD
jgi:ribose/xylose/arabinose/galactoside ABC-type transport system permease subunit